MRKRMLIVIGTLLAACGEKDETAPPPPFLDPVSSPTTMNPYPLSGSAEYGATVDVAGGAAAATGTADRYTARFRIPVQLKPGVNKLTATATDLAGNKSGASEEVTVELVGTPAKVTLDLFVNASTTAAADPVKVSVGDTITTKTKVEDSGGGVLNVPVDITHNLFGALIEGDKIVGIAIPGLYRAVATVRGTSIAAGRNVTVKPGAPDKMTMTLSRLDARAGDVVGVTVRVVDAGGNEILDAMPALDYAITGTANKLPPKFCLVTTTPCPAAQEKDQGLTATSGLAANLFLYQVAQAKAAAYSFTVTASLLRPPETPLTASAAVVVKPGPAAAASKFEFAGGGVSLTVSAGSDASYTYEAVDAYRNPTVGPATVSTTAPGALVIDDGVSGVGRITNLNFAGAYTVRLFLPAVGQSGSTLNLNVGPGAATVVSVTVSSTLTAPNSDVFFFALVRDQFGNLIQCSGTGGDVTWASNPTANATQVSTGCQNDLFRATYRFTKEGTYGVTATHTGSGTSGSAYVSIFGFDNTPPTVDIPLATLRVNGTVCTSTATPPACQVAPGDFIEFDVVANDNISLSEISFTAFFSTAAFGNQLRTRTVLVAANALLPVTQTFSFTVHNSAFLEDVPLIAQAIDGAGNRATSSQIVLRVSFGVFGGRTATLVARDRGGAFINAPEDVAVDSAGNVFIANSGNANVLKLATGANFPTLHLAAGAIQGLPGLGGFRPGFIAIDPQGNLYLTDAGGGSNDLVRVDTANPPVATNYVRYTDGAAELRGLSVVQATFAKGIVNVNATVAPVDGDRVTVGTNVYEISNTGSCPNVAFVAGATGACLTVAFGANSTDMATALANCINSGTGCVSDTGTGGAVQPHATVGATLSATPAPPSVILAAKATGTAGNAIALTATMAGGGSPCPRFNFNNAGNNCPITVSTLIGGQAETLMVGQTGAGASTIYRFPFSLTPAFPKTEAANVGAFSMVVAGQQHAQWGVAVKDIATATTRNLREYVFYFPDAAAGFNRLRGMRITDSAATVSVFDTLTCPAPQGCVNRTNDPGTPIRNFNRLWDVALEPKPTTTPLVAPDGCLLASDDGNGNIYTVDTRDPTTANPTVSVVAEGLANPRGLAFDAAGNLYVALQGADAIIKIGPSPSTTDCY